jgi:hypothetical protein
MVEDHVEDDFDPRDAEALTMSRNSFLGPVGSAQAIQASDIAVTDNLINHH